MTESLLRSVESICCLESCINDGGRYIFGFRIGSLARPTREVTTFIFDRDVCPVYDLLVD
jgi:hypothetical protein